jgi:phosphohistidine swiveling domain-containing protein
MERWVHDVHERCRKDAQRSCPSTRQYLSLLKARYDDVGNPWAFFGFFVDRFLCERVPELTDDYEGFARSVRPLHEPFLVQQTREATALRGRLQGAKTLGDLSSVQRQEVISHVERFRFCGIHHFVGEPYTVAKFFSDPSPAPVAEEAWHVPASLHWHHRLARLATWARTYMAETSGLLAYAFRPRLQQAEYDLGLEMGDILWLHIDEILQGLTDTNAFVKPDLEARKRKVGICQRGPDTVILTGESVERALREIHSPPSVTLPLRGTPGARGIASGPVKIVLHPRDVHKVEKGDVLVASETSPDFVPAMRRAAAIVTDVGGITTHAAIISRELGIPCVVGTKYATRTLKDGDHIVVDADKGIVDREKKK